MLGPAPYVDPKRKIQDRGYDVGRHPGWIDDPSEQWQ
jgi:hypothetical protein